MALTTTVSQKELARVANLAYEGETLKVMLCSVGATGYTAESTVANWQSVEQSGNGYVRFSSVIATGSYDAVDARYEIPNIDAAFTATGAGYNYDRIVIYIDGATYIHSLIVEDPNIALAAGQTQTYRIALVCDD
ncbi:MAG: hypothetical protein ACO3GP_02685 [Candidatus Limnocylindrus sp.]